MKHNHRPQPTLCSFIPINLRIEDEDHEIAQINVPGEWSDELQEAGGYWQNIFEASLPIVYIIFFLKDSSNFEDQSLDTTPMITALESGEPIWESQDILEAIPKRLIEFTETSNRLRVANIKASSEDFAHAVEILQNFILSRPLTLTYPF